MASESEGGLRLFLMKSKFKGYSCLEDYIDRVIVGVVYSFYRFLLSNISLNLCFIGSSHLAS